MNPEELAHARALDAVTASAPAPRRLSWWRVGAAVGVVATVVAAAVVGYQRHVHPAVAAKPMAAFAPYVDVTATPMYAFEDPTQSKAGDVVLGFVVSAAHAACTPSWGSAYSLDAAAATLDLDRRIARLRQRGGQVSVSFGGQANAELATACTNRADLTDAYRSVVDRYNPAAVDLDVEGAAASAPLVNARRAAAIAAVQQARAKDGHPLAVWLTLPVTPSGFTPQALGVLDALLAAHVDVAGVNAMTMDYGVPLPSGATMADVATVALTAVHDQVITAYGKAGINLSDGEAWQRVGATPMIGQNDVTTERFELTDAAALVTFLQSKRAARLSMWSLNRDQSCGPNYANVSIVSDACSGVSQKAGQYASTLAEFGSTQLTPAKTTGSTPTRMPTTQSTNQVDDPATSPYQIWNPDRAYPKGTKVVWHHNVYQAKWYTQGDTPDAPVAQPSDTPWTLIGPVLPGEHPQPTPTLPVGTYPAWNAATVYHAGDRVLFHGVPFQAKWYTQGDEPGTPSTNEAPSPWEELPVSVGSS
jgi:chitinase